MRPWAAAALALAVAAGAAQGACRQALALGLDVSGSVDAAEYRLQIDGLARALQSPEVARALLAMPGADVALTVYEWSGPGTQRSLLGWTAVTDAATLAGIAATLRAARRAPADPSTALGEAKAHGLALLAVRPDCWRHVLDISGDGQSNTGPRPEAIPVPPGTIVNGLVIGQPPDPQRRSPGIGELQAYYRTRVIDGPGAFVETALGFAAFEAAMRRKLVRELAVLPLARADTRRERAGP